MSNTSDGHAVYYSIINQLFPEVNGDVLYLNPPMPETYEIWGSNLSTPFLDDDDDDTSLEMEPEDSDQEGIVERETPQRFIMPADDHDSGLPSLNDVFPIISYSDSTDSSDSLAYSITSLEEIATAPAVAAPELIHNHNHNWEILQHLPLNPDIVFGENPVEVAVGSSSVSSPANQNGVSSAIHRTSDDLDRDFVTQGTPKRLRLAKNPEKPQETVKKEEEDDDGSADDCTICMDAITAQGDHRACCLKCGHVFGHSCILKWLNANATDKTKRVCPQCKMPSRTMDVRVLFCKRTVRVMDDSELVETKKDLQKTKADLKVVEEENNFNKMRQLTFRDENRTLKRDNENLQRMLDEYRRMMAVGGAGVSPVDQSAGISLPASPFPLAAKTTYRMLLDHIVELKSNARVMAFYPHQMILVMSQKLSGDAFGPFGKSSALKLVNCFDMKASDLMNVHCGEIRDISIDNKMGLALVASLDKTVTITSLNQRSIIHQYKEDAPVWSTAWNSEDSRYFYCGLSNGQVSVYDLRNTSQRVCSLDSARAPIHQLTFVDRRPGHQFPLGGLLVSSFQQCGFYTARDAALTNYEYIPLVQGSVPPMYATAYDRVTRLISTSYRPQGAYKTVRHKISELHYVAQNDPKVLINELHTLNGGSNGAQMSRGAFFTWNPSGGNTYVEAGKDEIMFAMPDQQSKSVMLWNLVDQKPKVELPVSTLALDICPFVANNKRMMAVLMENKLQVYSAAKCN